MTTVLTLATLVLFAEIAAQLLIPRLPIWARAGLRLIAFSLLTVLATRIVGSPLRPSLTAEAASERLWQQVIVAGWWFVGARCVAGAARLVLSLQNRSRETQILSDLIGAIVYVATALAVIDVAFDIPIGGLIATSGVVAIVFGLALQNTLADVFSGIAIDIERPYRAGDLLWVEGGIEGRVREVNWRSTLIETTGNDVAIIPNSIMAKSRLVNHSLPNATRRTSVEVRLDPRTPHDRCIATLRAAVKACMLPLLDPPPRISLIALHGDGAVYEIGFSVSSSSQVVPARTELLGRVQNHLEYAAISFALAGSWNTPVLSRPTSGSILARSDLFADMRAEDRELLAVRAVRVAFDENAQIIECGAEPVALYLVTGGTVEVERMESGKPRMIRRLGPGSCFGVMGLITGTPSVVTAKTLTPVEAFSLDKRMLQDAMGESETIEEGLKDAVRRIITTMDEVEAIDDHAAVSTGDILAKMGSFLKLLSNQADSDRP